MNDELLEELGALPVCALDEASDERVRARAREVFAKAEPEVPAWATTIAAAWRTRLEPSFVVAGSGVFLGWALKRTIELLS